MSRKKACRLVIFLLLVTPHVSVNGADGQTVTSSILLNSVSLDGKITSETEWVEAEPVDLLLSNNETQNPGYQPVTVRTKNDGQWIYFLFSVDRESIPIDQDD